MAKKEGEFSFNDLNNLMTKTSQWGGLMSDGAGVSEITDYIPTGNYLLNACLTGSMFKGIPNNRSVAFSGESGVGKTYLLLNVAREAQKKGKFVIWYDSENAIDIHQINTFGIDPTKFRYEPVGTVQEFRTSITNVVDTLIEQKQSGNKIPEVIFILDSVGNLATQKEVDDAKSGSEKADMTRPKVIRSIFRILMSKLGIIGATFCFSNHTYQSMDLFSQTQQSGGQGLVYGASIILNMSKAKLKEDGGTNQTGIRVISKPQKNRFCKPIPIEFHISFVRGMNPYVGLQDFISWERCGIQRGKFVTAKEYEKDPENTIKFDAPSGETMYFVGSETARNICTDSGVAVPLNQLFTKEVFTQDRLLRLDKYIQDYFSYPSGNTGDIEDLLSESVGDEDVSDMIADQLD